MRITQKWEHASTIRFIQQRTYLYTHIAHTHTATNQMYQIQYPKLAQIHNALNQNVKRERVVSACVRELSLFCCEYIDDVIVRLRSKQQRYSTDGRLVDEHNRFGFSFQMFFSLRYFDYLFLYIINNSIVNLCSGGVDDDADHGKKTVVVWPKRIKCMNSIQSIREPNGVCAFFPPKQRQQSIRIETKRDSISSASLLWECACALASILFHLLFEIFSVVLSVCHTTPL